MGVSGINGQSFATEPETALGQDFTSLVIQSMGPNTDPRLRHVISSFIQHIHDFARDVRLTTDEWMLGVQMINRAGQMSSDKRNEGQLMCDVIGLESLVDAITYEEAVKAHRPLTASAILGPFWRSDTPTRPNGSTITFDTATDAVVAYMYGEVTSADTGLPLANAVVDVWQCSTNGLYEQQDPAQREHNLRGKFVTDSNGKYSFYCIRPTPYPVPDDGPAGHLLSLMDRHAYRPAHIHLIVEAAKHKPVTTQIFDAESKYLDDDSVFAVKEALKVNFVPRQGDPEAKFELQYNVSLAVDPKA
ncbi:catechol dioxygenase [Ophiostoma piceae UAMH 11346]|uniref:Catechol dioxygenase n=1 Tax=Ophiostoma piceae (strain UAMH 11346) TaxID=1262450 RepID=S3BQH7_OPHP1|nr:catechol dioxygenase [Ophiostoma piceae UAMH 11346]